MNDAELLRAYVRDGSEAAFTELVERYAGLVYSTAWRRTGNAQLAEEVAQSVFCLLARKSSQLGGRVALAGWLYRATCHLADKALRAEVRRQKREREAADMNQNDSMSQEVWQRLSLTLDEALMDLGEKDRLAVLLRFFQRKSMGEVAETLGVSEAAAKMRVGRALERLRKLVTARGAPCSSTALALLLTRNTGQAVPQEILTSLASAGFSHSAAPFAPSGLEILFLMTGTKLRIASLSALLALAGGTYLASRPDGVDPGRDRARDTTPGVLETESRTAERAPALEDVRANPANASNLQEAITRLRGALRTPGANGRSFNLDEVDAALAAFGHEREAALAVLRADLEDPAVSVQEAAIYGLGELAKTLPGAVETLWEVLRSAPPRDGSPLTTRQRTASDAFYALEQTGFKSADVPALLDLLSTDTARHTLLVREVPRAVADLMQRDPAAAAAGIHSLETLLKADDPAVRFQAALALARHQGSTTAFEELRAFFELPNDSLREYQKMASLDLIRQLGPAAQPLVPALLAFAESANSVTTQDQVHQALAAIDPDLRKVLPHVDQVIDDEARSQEWSLKWASGSYTYQDLESALRDPTQALPAATRLAELGASAREAVPAMVRSIWGQEAEARDKILEAVRKIDPATTVIKVDAYPIAIGFQYAEEELRRREGSQRNRLLRSYLDLQPRTWYTREELADFAGRLAGYDESVSAAFVRGVLSEDPRLKNLFPRP